MMPNVGQVFRGKWREKIYHFRVREVYPDYLLCERLNKRDGRRVYKRIYYFVPRESVIEILREDTDG